MESLSCPAGRRGLSKRRPWVARGKRQAVQGQASPLRALSHPSEFERKPWLSLQRAVVTGLCAPFPPARALSSPFAPCHQQNQPGTMTMTSTRSTFIDGNIPLALPRHDLAIGRVQPAVCAREAGDDDIAAHFADAADGAGVACAQPRAREWGAGA